ncbi:MAG: SPFH domain-containing protein [Myxococcota bacterium]|nr:SPFH domain-containing protein [Myxococcota bacterium]
MGTWGLPWEVIAAIVGLLVLVAVLPMIAFSRFFRRCGADEALVRTGSGGNKVVIGGGVMLYPIFHQLLRVSLRSVKLSVERAGKNALVTADKIKANVTTELYIKVEPIQEDVLAAARSFGERNLDERSIADLIEGKLTDALRSVAANQDFMNLHGKRKEFAEMIQATLAEELKKNGLTLENVSITSLSMVPVTELDATDVFDAEGLRAITESVQTNREKTNQIQREKDNQIHAQDVTARMRALELEQAQKHAEADQARKVSEYAAIQSAETAKAVLVQEQSRDLAAYEKQRAVEQARIVQEREVAIAVVQKQRAEREAQIEAEKAQITAEIAKQRAVEAAEIEKQTTVQSAEIARQKAIEASTIEKEKVVGASLVDKEKAIEVARIAKQVAVIQSEEQAARAAAARATARAEEEAAKQTIITAELTAKAERERAIAGIEAASHAEVERALAAGEANKTRELAEAQIAKARGEAQSLEAVANAEANRRRAHAQGEADAQRIAAEAAAEASFKEAEAIKQLAEAARQKGLAEAEARRAMIAAESSVGDKLLLRDVALKAIEVAPELARELMLPAQKITEIKVLQTNGVFGGEGGSPGAVGAMSPILKTIMEAGAAYPLMRELLVFGKVDGAQLTEKARDALGSLAPELQKVLGERPPAPSALEVVADAEE